MSSDRRGLKRINARRGAVDLRASRRSVRARGWHARASAALFTTSACVAAAATLSRLTLHGAPSMRCEAHGCGAGVCGCVYRPCLWQQKSRHATAAAQHANRETASCPRLCPLSIILVIYMSCKHSFDRSQLFPTRNEQRHTPYRRGHIKCHASTAPERADPSTAPPCAPVHGTRLYLGGSRSCCASLCNGGGREGP